MSVFSSWMTVQIGGPLHLLVVKFLHISPFFRPEVVDCNSLLSDLTIPTFRIVLHLEVLDTLFASEEVSLTHERVEVDAECTKILSLISMVETNMVEEVEFLSEICAIQVTEVLCVVSRQVICTLRAVLLRVDMPMN